MFEQLFSNQWFFDRCVEAEFIFIPLIIVISILILYVLNPLLKKYKPLLIMARILIPFGIYIGALMLGFSVCRASFFWKGIRPAFELNKTIMVLCSNNECPKDQEELNKLDTDLYQKILSNAKFKYSVDLKTNEYVWYVRPSKYYVGIYQDEGFSLYKIPSLLPVNFFRKVPTFTGDKKLLP